MKEIKLTKGYMALVSDEDFERVSVFKWCASIEGRGTKVCAIRRITVSKGVRKKVRMHHFILDVPPGSLGLDMAVNHINDDGLDNRRENLEIVTQRENMLKSRGWRRKACFEPSL